MPLSTVAFRPCAVILSKSCARINFGTEKRNRKTTKVGDLMWQGNGPVILFFSHVGRWWFLISSSKAWMSSWFERFGTSVCSSTLCKACSSSGLAFLRRPVRARWVASVLLQFCPSSFTAITRVFTGGGLDLDLQYSVQTKLRSSASIAWDKKMIMV